MRSRLVTYNDRHVDRVEDVVASRRKMLQLSFAALAGAGVGVGWQQYQHKLMLQRSRDIAMMQLQNIRLRCKNFAAVIDCYEHGELIDTAILQACEQDAYAHYTHVCVIEQHLDPNATCTSSSNELMWVDESTMQQARVNTSELYVAKEMLNAVRTLRIDLEIILEKIRMILRPQENMHPADEPQAVPPQDFQRLVIDGPFHEV